MVTPDPGDARRRAAIRQFVLAHHPDRGGDPAVFDAGLRALRAGSRTGPADLPRAADVTRPNVVIYRKRGPAVVLAAWLVRRWAWPARRERPTRVQ